MHVHDVSIERPRLRVLFEEFGQSLRVVIFERSVDHQAAKPQQFSFVVHVETRFSFLVMQSASALRIRDKVTESAPADCPRLAAMSCTEPPGA